MNGEYQRLRDAARDVDREIAELERNSRVRSAAELVVMEKRLDELAVKRGSLAKAIILLQSVDDPEFQRQQKEFIRNLPQKYHAHGTRQKVVHLPGGVDVTLQVTYSHRQKDPAKASGKPQRGLYPALILLGISEGFTPTVRQRMAKASALLGSFEEAKAMLAEAGITASVNTLGFLPMNFSTNRREVVVYKHPGTSFSHKYIDGITASAVETPSVNVKYL